MAVSLPVLVPLVPLAPLMVSLPPLTWLVFMLSEELLLLLLLLQLQTKMPKAKITAIKFFLIPEDFVSMIIMLDNKIPANGETAARSKEKLLADSY